MKIFISYSSKNRNLINNLVRLLQEAGYEVTYDQQVRIGDFWPPILRDIRACNVFLYAITPEYLASYPCDLEYHYAEALHRPLCPTGLTAIESDDCARCCAVAGDRPERLGRS